MPTGRSPTEVVQDLATLVRAREWDGALALIDPESVARWRKQELGQLAQVLRSHQAAQSSLEAIPQDLPNVEQLLSDYGSVRIEAGPGISSIAQLVALPPSRLLQLYWALGAPTLEWAHTEVLGEFVEGSRACVVCQWPAQPSDRLHATEPIDILLRQSGAEWLVVLEWEVTRTPLWAIIDGLIRGAAGAA